MQHYIEPEVHVEWNFDTQQWEETKVPRKFKKWELDTSNLDTTHWARTLKGTTRVQRSQTFIKYQNRIGTFIIGDSVDGDALMLKFKRRGSKNVQWMRIGPTKRGMQIIHFKGKLRFMIVGANQTLSSIIRKFLTRPRDTRDKIECFNVYMDTCQKMMRDIHEVFTAIFKLKMGSFDDLENAFMEIKYPHLKNRDLSMSSRMRKHIHTNSDDESVIHSICKGKKSLKKLILAEKGRNQFKMGALAEILLRKRDAKKMGWNIGYIRNVLPYANRIWNIEEAWEYIFKYYTPKAVISRLSVEAGDYESDCRILSSIKDTLTMLVDMRKRDIPYDLPRRLPSIIRLHDEVVGVLNNYNTMGDREEIKLERTKSLYTDFYSDLDGIKVDDLYMSIPKTKGDLMDVGQSLSNCVASYGGVVASGHSVIILLRNDDMIKYCIELRPDADRYQITAFLGYKNNSCDMDIQYRFAKILNQYIDVDMSTFEMYCPVANVADDTFNIDNADVPF